MKRTVFLLGILGFALIVIGLPFDKGEAAPPIVIKAVSAWPVSHPGNQYYKEYIKRVNEKAKGELEIQLLGGPEVVSAFDQLKALSTGVVDMIHGDASYYAGIVSEGTILGLAKPGSYVQAFRESGVIDDYKRAYLERGKAVFLGAMWIGMPFYIMTTKPVSKLDDLRGLKLRSMGGLSDVFLGELGTSVVKIASAETYEVLQRGIVDGALRNTVSLIEFKEYEVLKYIVFPGAYSPAGTAWIGEKKWNSIPKHLQTMLEATAIEVEAEAAKYFEETDAVRLKEVQEKHGMKIVYLGEKEIARLNGTRAGAAVKDWIYKKAPVYGPSIFEKMIPYIK